MDYGIKISRLPKWQLARRKCQNGRLKFLIRGADIFSIDGLTRRKVMIQWISVLIALLGFAYNGVKDYQHGEINIPVLENKKELTKPVYPIQYCLMAYDPNLDKVFYQHENGQWYDYAPQQRRYSPTP